MTCPDGRRVPIRTARDPPFGPSLPARLLPPVPRAQGSVQRIAAIDLQASLPPELLGSLQGMRLGGTFAGDSTWTLDTAKLDSVRLDLQPDVSDLQVLSLGDTVDLGLLRSVFPPPDRGDRRHRVCSAW
jgi:hypothetical protein